MKKIFAILLFLPLISLACARAQKYQGADYKIPLSPDAKFYHGDTVFYQLNDLMVTGGANALLNYQEADPLHGIQGKMPPDTWSSGYPTHNNYPSIVVIDLGGLYEISHQFIYDHWGTDSVNVDYGTPFHWKKLGTYYENGNGWVDIDTTRIRTRYLKLWYSNTGYQKIRQLILYGHLIGDSLSRTPPRLHFNHAYAGGNTMGNFMGLNTAGAIPPQVKEGIAGVFRNYTNQYYMDTAVYMHDINKVNFVFSKFSAGNTAVKYYFPGDTGGEKGPLLAYTFSDASDSGMGSGSRRIRLPFYSPAFQGVNQMEMEHQWERSIDYTAHPYADSTHPESYDRLSRMMWMYGAAFGKNKYPADSLQYTIPANHVSGLNTTQFVESGNENNGSWLSKERWYSPQAWIAYNSAFYDGNDGRMGNRFGIKQADPTIQVVMGGNAYDWYPYMKAMAYWAYYSRSDHKIPFDIYNFHDYEYVKGKPHSAFQPENYHAIGYHNIRAYWQQIVDSVHAILRTKVWNTEWGYDRNSSLENAVAVIPGVDSAQVQAEWIARSWIMQSFVRGLDVSVYYMLANANWKDYDSAAFNNYATCGLVSGAYHGTPCCSFNFYAFPTYYFQHTMYHVLRNYKPDSILYENSLKDSIYMYRYRNIDHPDSVAYVVWSGTITNKTVQGLKLKTGLPNHIVYDIHLKYKYMDGDTSRLRTDGRGEIPLIIDETPQIILTKEGFSGGELYLKKE